MIKNHRGFSLALILITVAVVAAGAWYFMNSNGVQDAAPQAVEEEGTENTPSETESAQVEQKVSASVSLPLSLTITNLDGATNNMTFTADKYQLIQVVATPSKVLLCPSTHYGDTDGCRILIVDVATKTATELGFPDQAPDRSLIPSPDKKQLLLATESRIVIIDITTLDYRVVYTSSKETVPGYYGCLPSFYSAAVWASATTIRVPIYNKEEVFCDKEPLPAPIEVRSVTI